jgi:phosphatidylglycerophosphatase A
MRRKGRPLPVPGHLLRDPGHLLALGFGSGLAPYAPGTFGSVVGVVAYPALQALGPWGYWLAVLGLFVAGVPLCARTATALDTADHPAIVWDEVVGMLVTLGFAADGWPALLVGFVLFRMLDIVKPWPIRWLDRRVGGGIGIMLDDLAAGVAAGLVLVLINYLS